MPNSPDSPAKPAPPCTIGLIAGWGRFPIVVAEALKSQGYRVAVLGLKDHADPQLEQIADVFGWVGLARLASAIRFFRRADARFATMAGKVFKTRLFQRFSWIKHTPDLLTFRTFLPHFVTRKKDCKDDTLLSEIVNVFARGGVTFAPATDFAPELLVKLGHLTRKRLSWYQQKDAEFGWELAKEMGRLDVGQSVAVKGSAVLAVEAVEGTDECIRRAGQLCPSGGFTIVKVAKPQQDMRFDVPTIGIGTLQTMAAAGAAALIIEADKTIVVDSDEVARFADQKGIAIAALEAGQLSVGKEAA